MENPDKSIFPNEESAERLPSRYKQFLAIGRTGKPCFDTYLKNLADEMLTYDKVNPYKKGSLNPITDKANAFLLRHAGISYEDFLKQSKSEDFTENDYGKLPQKKNLRRRLFAFRSMLYLSALEDYDQQGHNLDDVLAEIKDSTIPYIKKEQEEPTFREILKVLGKCN